MRTAPEPQGPDRESHRVTIKIEKPAIHDVNVVATTPLTVPRQLKAALPISSASLETVLEGRETIRAILRGEDPRMLVVVGPCSIHDVKAALEYAERLAALRRRVADRLYVVMRVYFEKPRTTIGWKGLINDPHLDGSFDMSEGLRLARKLLLDITAMGLPAGTEMLEPITPQYIDDLVSWTAVGARTTESQTHRQMASGLSMPVGFKNSTDGNLQVAIDAMTSARSPHHFLGIDEDGRTCIVATRGNPDGHVILRGGAGRPNYDPQNVGRAATQLADAGLPPRMMVDCSHANAGKRHERQEIVWKSLMEQRRAWSDRAGGTGSPAVIGAMIESHLHEGRQDIPADRSDLRYGVSVTDECIGWQKTQELLCQG